MILHHMCRCSVGRHSVGRHSVGRHLAGSSHGNGGGVGGCMEDRGEWVEPGRRRRGMLEPWPGLGGGAD